VVIDDRALFEQVRDYVGAVNPELADRVEYYDPEVEALPIFERYHVHEQLHKALDRKVFLPSGGSLIIERTEALTVIDVNTGKNVGKTNLEETVYRNNLEAAEEVARQLRLRDIGGIIVIDFIDMEIRENRDKVAARPAQRPGPGQDPHPGLRHLRAGPGRDDPEAGLRGPFGDAVDRVRRLKITAG
jgi:ribonuclease E